MKKSKLIPSVFFLVVFFLASHAGAVAYLSFSPNSTSLGVGEYVDVDIVISGMENENIAAFDFVVNFDNTILSLDSYLFGNGLGDVNTGEAMDLSIDQNLVEISWLWDFGFQEDSFTLATISFLGLAEGQSDLFLSDIILSNDNWPAEAIDYDTEVASIEVAPVPEPATMLLLGIGIVGLGGIYRKKS